MRAIIALWLALAAMPAHAYTFFYTGAPFTDTGCEGTCSLFGPPSGIPPPLIGVFYDVSVPDNGTGFFPVYGTLISTQALGAFGSITLNNWVVTNWSLSAFISTTGGVHFSIFMDTSQLGDSVRQFVSVSAIHASASAFGSGPAGTWSGGPLIQTPIPGALTMFLTGLVLLGFLLRRTRR